MERRRARARFFQPRTAHLLRCPALICVYCFMRLGRSRGFKPSLIIIMRLDVRASRPTLRYGLRSAYDLINLCACVRACMRKCAHLLQVVATHSYVRKFVCCTMDRTDEVRLVSPQERVEQVGINNTHRARTGTHAHIHRKMELYLRVSALCNVWNSHTMISGALLCWRSN